jgi:putative hydrolase of the HAD superfamily
VPQTVVFDLGEVLVPSAGMLPAVAQVLGIGPDELAGAYWRERRAYDLGGSTSDYWSGVLAELGREPDPATIAALDERDAAYWSAPPRASLELLATLSGEGARLGLLSNAPRSLATAVGAASWSGVFDTLVFSGELGLAKPDPAIYAAADRAYGTVPGDVVFLDDRPENVEAANAHGWTAHLCTGPGDAARILGR